MYKKKLKILKGGNQTLSIEEGQTTHWPKDEKTKEQTMIYKTLQRKLKIKQHEQHYMKIGDEFGCSGRVGSSCP
jgi:hypothetical protein